MSKKRLDLQMFADASAQLQNTTGAAGMTAEMKTYYEKDLLDLAEPALVHDQFGDSYPIPANNGKTIEFRKYDALPKATTPLTEGVTPGRSGAERDHRDRRGAPVRRLGAPDRHAGSDGH